MRKYAVIVAGGSGIRMGGGVPKQFRSLCGRPVLWWSMKAFHNENPDTDLILVLPEPFISFWADLFNSLPDEDRFPHLTTAGGNTRSDSVVNGLSLVEDDALVAIHDGARPLVSADIISKGWETALKEATAVPVVPVTDSLRKIAGTESEAADRSKFVAVQTPQVFNAGLLKKAYGHAAGRSFTDDASVVENYGHKITLYEGSPDNMKVTNPKDLAIAEILMAEDA